MSKHTAANFRHLFLLSLKQWSQSILTTVTFPSKLEAWWRVQWQVRDFYSRSSRNKKYSETITVPKNKKLAKYISDLAKSYCFEILYIKIMSQ
jgi:hypothetical protein